VKKNIVSGIIRLCEDRDIKWIVQSMPLDAQQLAELIEKNAGSLRIWIRSRCASSEDVVQEAFCRLAVQDPPPDNPVAWLYRVCKNLAEKQRTSDSRRHKREQTWAQVNRSRSSGNHVTKLSETLAEVELLDDDLREVLIARIWGRLSFEEVGLLCEISTATAFRRYETALKLLRAKLDRQPEERP
jgi:RNA polymerase sigma factor (sigma-70 family)